MVVYTDYKELRPGILCVYGFVKGEREVKGEFLMFILPYIFVLFSERYGMNFSYLQDYNGSCKIIILSMKSKEIELFFRGKSFTFDSGYIII